MTDKPKKKAVRKKGDLTKNKAGSAENRRRFVALKQRCFELYKAGWAKARIAEELNVQPASVYRWFKQANITREEPDDDPTKDVFQADLEDTVTDVIEDERMNSRDEEQKALLEIAENQSSPADQYQAYIAASSIKMLRDNLMNVRGPRTIRELSELDQLIRRNLGLAPKGGSGSSGTLTIDLSILNNTKAAGAASVVIDAELNE